MGGDFVHPFAILEGNEYNLYMKMNRVNRSVVEETNLGLYLWSMPNGLPVGDDEGNYLNIPSVKGDREKIAILERAVRSYGITEGHPVFLAGTRRITDDEFEEQKARQKAGLVPDPYDVAAIKEQMRYGKQFN